MVSLVHRHDGLVGVVVLVCLARVVFAGGVNRPHDELATRAFAGDDENVVHVTVSKGERKSASAALAKYGDTVAIDANGTPKTSFS